MEWNHERVERIIELYKGRRELWDPSDNNFHIKCKKNDAWVEIAKEMGCEVSEVKNKMTSLLSSYRREKAKMKNSIGAGKAREEIYESSWFAFKWFGFLIEKDIFANSVSNDSYRDEEDLSRYSFHTLYEQDLTTAELEQPAASSERERSLKRKTGGSSKRLTKKLRTKKEWEAAHPYNALQSVSNETYDECSTFGEHIAMRLRKFDERGRTILMHRVNNLLYEAEMELYSQQYAYATGSSSEVSAPSTPLASPKQEPQQFVNNFAS